MFDFGVKLACLGIAIMVAAIITEKQEVESAESNLAENG